VATPTSRPRSANGPVFVRPLVDFLHTEAAGGIVLIGATLLALVWANSPWKESYADLWHTRLAIDFGGHVLDLDLREWINDGLMAVFFLVVGLEIKRELVDGELREPRRAATPAIAAIGGMVVPALIYTAVNVGGAGADGWGIPMATDIAMTVGVLSLLGRRVAPSLKLFLLALAIVDDIGAILVIAVFYAGDLQLDSLLAAIGLMLLVVVLRAVGVRSNVVYIAVGVALWLALHESGVHATLAGVFMGLMAPTQPFLQEELIDAEQLANVSTVVAARETVQMAKASVSVVEWLEHRLHPITSFAVVPLFALANAGVPITLDAVGDAATGRVAYGVVLGLVIGKLVGVTAFTWLAIRLGLGELPQHAGWRGIVGIGALAGIGFTVSIFVTGLAFDDVALQNEAILGVVAASAIAAALGSAILSRAQRAPRPVADLVVPSRR
jgi:Na+:H+ antiporter, NhaA family